jgi:hypothetical protein
MNPFLLFLLLDLPTMPGPVVPAEFPSEYRMGGADSLDYIKQYVWIGSDTLLVYNGTPPLLAYRIDFAAGCPVRETRLPIDGNPQRVTETTCSGGHVTGLNGPSGRDSTLYLYHSGLPDSMVTFFRNTLAKPFKPSHTMKTIFDAEGRPVSRLDRYFEEGSDTVTESLVNTYVYHLPDSIEMRTSPDESGETRVTVFRLQAGKVVSMTETVTEVDPSDIDVYNHYWSYGVIAALRDPGRGSAGKAVSPAAGRLSGRIPGKGEMWRPDGRLVPADRR